MWEGDIDATQNYAEQVPMVTPEDMQGGSHVHEGAARPEVADIAGGDPRAVALFVCAPAARGGHAEASQHDLPTTWEAFDLAASELAERVSFLAADITHGTCDADHAIDPLASLAVGSSQFGRREWCSIDTKHP